jgi:hypothetical protein
MVKKFLDKIFYCQYFFLLTFLQVAKATQVAAVNASGIFHPAHLFVQSSDGPRGKQLSFTSTFTPEQFCPLAVPAS